MIYTSYFAKLKSLPDNIIPISICGKAPDWYNGLQYKKLAPKYDFFIKWKESNDNDYYIKCFNELVLNVTSVKEVLSDIYKILPENFKDDLESDIYNWFENPFNHIVLICYEKPSDFCHRHLVADWLNKNGFRCEEWNNETK